MSASFYLCGGTLAGDGGHSHRNKLLEDETTVNLFCMQLNFNQNVNRKDNKIALDTTIWLQTKQNCNKKKTSIVYLCLVVRTGKILIFI